MDLPFATIMLKILVIKLCWLPKVAAACGRPPHGEDAEERLGRVVRLATKRHHDPSRFKVIRHNRYCDVARAARRPRQVDHLTTSESLPLAACRKS